MVISFGCSRDATLSPGAQQTQSSSSEFVSVGGVQEILGETGPGSVYGIWVPESWNGDLVLYAHGFVDPALPVGLPTGDGVVDMRDGLLDLGYAVAYSSFSYNGLEVKDGAQRTKQLRGIFADEFGEPERTYLTGHSLGGLIAVMLAEKYPGHYAGALPMSGIVGGSQGEIDYFAHVRVLFDFFYGPILPGDAMNIPPGVDLMNDVVLPAIAAVTADPTGLAAISVVDQTPLPGDTPEELVESLVRALGYNFRAFGDVFDRTHDHYPFDNSGTVYSSSMLPGWLLDAINAGVDRFESTPDARAYMRHYYEPTGELEIPVLTLHGNQDPVAPIFNETMYAQAVADAGKSDLLVQRTIDEYFHTEYYLTDPGVTAMLQAFQDLVNWVENGIKPTP
jgi:pimeloyl-ACP methyl ester carboxylesterase